MNSVKDKLDFLASAEKFVIVEWGNGYMVYEKNSDIEAFIHESGKVAGYYLSGCYNSGNDLMEIDLDELERLRKFVSYLIEEKEK